MTFVNYPLFYLARVAEVTSSLFTKLILSIDYLATKPLFLVLAAIACVLFFEVRARVMIKKNLDSKKEIRRGLKVFGMSVRDFLTLAVTLSSVLVALQAIKISDEALKVTRLQLQPQFTFRLMAGDQLGEGGVDQIRIFGEQGKFRNLNAVPLMFFEMYDIGDGYSRVADVSIFNYYTYFTPDLKGADGLVYAVLSPPNKFKVLAKREKELEDYLSEHSTASTKIIGVDVQRYIKVEYQDILGEQHTLYYSVSEYGGYLLNEKDVQSVLERWSKKGKIKHSLDPLSSDVAEVVNSIGWEIEN